jgi:hypothetical protein
LQVGNARWSFLTALSLTSACVRSIEKRRPFLLGIHAKAQSRKEEEKKTIGGKEDWGKEDGTQKDHQRTESETQPKSLNGSLPFHVFLIYILFHHFPFFFSSLRLGAFA